MELLSVEFIIIYCLYSILTRFQYAQLRFSFYVETNQKIIQFLIESFAFIGIAFQLIIIIYLGFSQHWYVPFFLFGINFFVEKVYVEFEKAVGLNKFGVQIYLMSLFAIPVCGYLMVVTQPL